MQTNPYQKTEWIDHIIDPTLPEDDPNRAIQEGTRHTATRMNNIEDGIYNAYQWLILYYAEINRMQAELEVVGRAPINNGSFLDVLDGSTPRNMVPQDERAVAQTSRAAGATTIQLDANPFAVGTVVTVYDDVNAESVRIQSASGKTITVTPLTKAYKKGAFVARSTGILAGEELTFGEWGTYSVTATEVV